MVRTGSSHFFYYFNFGYMLFSCLLYVIMDDEGLFSTSTAVVIEACSIPIKIVLTMSTYPENEPLLLVYSTLRHTNVNPLNIIMKEFVAD